MASHVASAVENDRRANAAVGAVVGMAVAVCASCTVPSRSTPRHHYVSSLFVVHASRVPFFSFISGSFQGVKG